MIAAFQRRPLAMSLAALAAVLAVIVAVELAAGGGLRPALPLPSGKPAAAGEAKLLPPVVAAAPEQAYPETTARPLFLQTRRPAPEAPVADKKTFVPGQFTLQGVTVAGNTRIAMLREKASGRIHRVERGREVNGIQVIEIQPEVVTLGQGDQREVLSLQVQRPAGAPPAPVQAGPFSAAPPTPGTAQPAASPPTPATPAGPSMAPSPVMPTPARTGAFPPATAQTSPGTPQANPVARDQAAPMTPEELLARRRARRNQQTQ